MKSFFALIFTFLIAHGIYSQGNNLQFNQVVNQDFSTSGLTSAQNLAWFSSGTITVGPNKVLKITSCSAFYVSSSDGYDYATSMRIDDKMVYSYNTGNSYVSNDINMPVWLGEGSYTVKLYKVTTSGSSQYTLKGSISGVEFNIVQ